MKKISEKWILSPHLAEMKVEYVSTGFLAEKPILCSPAEINGYLRLIWSTKTIELREEFYVLLFNTARRCLGWSKTSIGGRSATIVEISQILAIALLTNSASIIVAHNHPNGKVKPSTSDIQLTKRIYDALKLVGLRLDDHIILTKEDFYSFRNANQPPFSYSTC
jgi:DNA repair protein RadC